MVLSKASVSERWVDPLRGVLSFGCALVVYGLTLTPSLSFKSPDGTELATVSYQLGLAHSTGCPLYTWLGKIFTFIPLGDMLPGPTSAGLPGAQRGASAPAPAPGAGSPARDYRRS